MTCEATTYNQAHLYQHVCSLLTSESRSCSKLDNFPSPRFFLIPCVCALHALIGGGTASEKHRDSEEHTPIWSGVAKYDASVN